jgi:excinuclease UvrABC nuclease subunit
MQDASDELRFEAAARSRDQLKTIVKLGEQQKMMVISREDIDIFGYYREGPLLHLSLFTMREGES